MWTSGLIEHLKINKKGEICAEGFGTKYHKIFKKDEYYCVEVQPSTLMTVGEQIDAAQRVAIQLQRYPELSSQTLMEKSALEILNPESFSQD